MKDADGQAGQQWRAQSYQTHAGFVPQLGQAALDLLEPRAGERILDLGCGDGVLTQTLAETGAVVTGVDSSVALVDAARTRGLDIRLMDAAALEFDQAFDAVFSNAALHWMCPAQAVIAGVARALRPGGRFVGEMGGFGNVAAIRVALHMQLTLRGLDPTRLDPWYFPTVEDYARRLQAGGFQMRTIELIPRPTPLPTDMRGWLETFAETFTRAVPANQRDGFLDEVCESLRPALCDTRGGWIADYVRLRFCATLAEI